MPLTEQLADYVRPYFTGIEIQSHEHAQRGIARLCQKEKWRRATWDIDGGLRLPGQIGVCAGRRIRSLQFVR